MHKSGSAGLCLLKYSVKYALATLSVSNSMPVMPNARVVGPSTRWGAATVVWRVKCRDISGNSRTVGVGLAGRLLTHCDE